MCKWPDNGALALKIVAKETLLSLSWSTHSNFGEIRLK